MDISNIRLANLRKLAEIAGGRPALADKLEMAYSQLTHLIGKTPIRNIGNTIARKAETAFDLPHGWMDQVHDDIPVRNYADAQPIEMTPVIGWQKPSDLPDGEFFHIPHFKIDFSAGHGRTAFEPIPNSKSLAFRYDWARENGISIADLFVVDLVGDSMWPTLRDGSAVLFNRAKRRVIDRSVYALRYGDQLKIKRLETRYDKALILISDNKIYEPEVIPVEDLEAGFVEVLGEYEAFSYDGKL